MADQDNDNRTSDDQPVQVLDTDRMLDREFAFLFGNEFIQSDASPSAGATPFDAACRAMAPERAPRALCLSGGGIRSATFSLGVLQGLQKAGQVGELDQFSHLSTVSGGGYIGSWLSRWRAGDVHEDGSTILPRPTMAEALHETPDVVRPPEHPIRRLRGFSSFLSPSWGFSLDTLTAVTIVLRNLLFNWIVWVPLLLFVAMVPRMLAALVVPALKWSGRLQPPYKPADTDAYWVFAVTWSVPLVLAVAWAVAALAVFLVRTMSETRRERLSRWGGWCLLAGIGWIGLFLLLVYIPRLLLSAILEKSVLFRWLSIGNDAEAVSGLSFGLTGLITAAVSAIGFWSRYGTEIRTRTAGIAVALGARVLDLAALIAIVAIAACSAIAAQMLPRVGERLAALAGLQVSQDPNVTLTVNGFNATIAAGGWSPVLIGVALIAVAFVASAFVGNNRYSLHGLYGNRLVRAYLGSARPKREDRNAPDVDPASTIDPPPPPRKPDFDPADNIDMGQLVPSPLFHVVNMTLNLARPTKASLDWQERKGASFVATPLHCGSPVTGYMEPKEFDGESGMTLGRAMTISGAAASPNMGFHSSPLVTLLLTIMNVRLGWWVRNPKWFAGKPDQGPLAAMARRAVRYMERKRSDPLFALYYAVVEAASGTNYDSAWLYLSDGGHFDNLGLYEMVRRRCRRIVVVDAGCDGDFDYADLMTAIRLVQVDLAVPIDLPAVLPGQDGPGGQQRIAVGRIRYSALPGWQDAEGAGERRDGDARDDGQLFVVKPILLGNEPPLFDYYREVSRRGKNAFPHHSTLDQFFDESQFESYRALGEFSATDLLVAMHSAGPPGSPIDCPTFEAVRERPAPQAQPAASVASPSPLADLGTGRLLLALLGGAATLGVASGVGQSVADTMVSSTSDRESVVERRVSTTERVTRSDQEVLDALLRLIDLLEQSLGERQRDPRLIIEIEQLVHWFRTRPDRSVTVSLDPALLRRISSQLEALSAQSATQHGTTIAELRESKKQLEDIARSVPATGPRRNIRGSQ